MGERSGDELLRHGYQGQLTPVNLYMPFAFTKRGARNNVAEFIKKQTENGADGKPLEDQSLIESAKSAALSQLGALPKDFNGALVICEGHANPNNRSITVQVIGEDHA